MRAAATALLAVTLGACAQPAPPPPEPVGRYQFISKERYEDGTIEYACLDTVTGEIGYSTLYANPARAADSKLNCR